jgi:L,D-transpeptidase YbiS
MSDEIVVEINITRQTLDLFVGNRCQRSYLVSTALNGPGELNGSECTPRGKHAVAEMIGEGYALNTVFVGRKVTGEIYNRILEKKFPKRDWILTRVIWLKGLEARKNLGGICDTQARYIYIHGTPDEFRLGRVGSHGCIRMANSDIVELYDSITVDTPVNLLT